MTFPENSSVIFSKPDLAEISSEGLIPVDMHFHTVHSDAYAGVEEIISRARRMGLGVAITDHNQVSGAVEAINYSDEVLVIPGIELSSREGPHILLYFYDIKELEDFYQREVQHRKGGSPHMAIDMGCGELIEIAGEYNCVKVAPHPYGYLFLVRGLQKSIDLNILEGSMLEKIDALEVINGALSRTLNVKAKSLAIEMGLGVTGGTDGHRLTDLGRVISISEESTIEGFLSAVVKKRIKVVGLERNPVQKGFGGMFTMAKHMRYAWPSLKVHYNQNISRIRRKLS
jgi:hypothetical protein